MLMFALLLLGTLLLALPLGASAHEVYVLSPEVVAQALALPSFSEWDVIVANLSQFVFWGFLVAIVIFIVFFVSISRTLENVLDPFLAKLPPYAPAIGRITIGLSFLAAAYFGALFGPELPLVETFGAYATLVQVLLVAIGLCLLFGYYTRTASLLALVLFAVEVFQHGTYLFTYTNYAAELFILLILGAHTLGFHHKKHEQKHAPAWILSMKEKLAPYTFLILRVGFGISLIFASGYAKIVHDNLALAVTQAYPAVSVFFGLEPHFLVLGAAIIEILIGTFFILGIEIRFTSFFLLFWLSLSLWYFKESVWPHVILIGMPLAFMFYGYDKYSLEGRFFKKNGREPVL